MSASSQIAPLNFWNLPCLLDFRARAFGSLRVRISPLSLNLIINLKGLPSLARAFRNRPFRRSLPARGPRSRRLRGLRVSVSPGGRHHPSKTSPERRFHFPLHRLPLASSGPATPFPHPGESFQAYAGPRFP